MSDETSGRPGEEVVTTTTIRVHTHRSVFWWFFVGWWYVPIKWIVGFPVVVYRRIRGHRPGDIKVQIRNRSGPGS